MRRNQVNRTSVKDTNGVRYKELTMATKTETFFLESEGEAKQFAASCLEEGMTATLLPSEDHDGRKYYPVKVTFDPSLLGGKK